MKHTKTYVKIRPTKDSNVFVAKKYKKKGGKLVKVGEEPIKLGFGQY
jgi:hypothetical protein